MLSKKAARLLAEPPLNKKLRRVLAGVAKTPVGVVPRERPQKSTKPIDPDKDPGGKVFSRTEIVSEKLCDDLIEYLAPSLKPYKGCTILDVHPGACLWSQKLHNFLKPKCHILMEPDELYTNEFIKPLLKKSSRYKHCSLPFYNPGTWGYYHPYAKALEAARGPGMQDIPSLSTSERDYNDLRLRLLDARLIMTGNLSRIYPKQPPQNILFRETISALDNSQLHRNGLVRQLWWLPDAAKIKVAACPHVLSGRNSTTTMLSLAANITEVAGVEVTTKPEKRTKTAQSSQRTRNAAANAENKLHVNARMHASGMRVPEGRQLLTHADSAESQDGVLDLKSPFTIHHHTVAEVSQAIEEFDALLDDIRAVSDDGSFQAGGPELENLVQRIEYPQCLSAAIENAAQRFDRQNDGISTNTQRKAIYLDTMLRMINLETHVVVLREQGIDIEDLKTRLGKLDREIQEKLMPTQAEVCTVLVEDQMLHFSCPQNFMYDRRTHEPILASKDDFWPKTGLALYDVVPSSRDMDVEGIADRKEVVKLARELSKLLFQYKASRVTAALDRIAPNAAQDLIPKVLSLTDPRKGGRLDVRNVICRMVNEDVFEDLVRAWFEWPFKPERYELEIAAHKREG